MEKKFQKRDDYKPSAEVLDKLIVVGARMEE